MGRVGRLAKGLGARESEVGDLVVVCLGPKEFEETIRRLGFFAVEEREDGLIVEYRLGNCPRPEKWEPGKVPGDACYEPLSRPSSVTRLREARKRQR